MSPTPRWGRAAVLPAVIALAFAGGCNSKDGSNNPANAGGTNTGFDQTDISLSAVGAMDFATEFVSEIRALSTADFSGITIDLNSAVNDAFGGPRRPVEMPVRIPGGGRTAPEVVWVPAEQSWVVDATENETTPEGSATASLYFAVQYRTAAGTPQQLPDANTTTMSVDANMAIDLEGNADGQVFDLSLDYVMAMTVGGLPAGPYAVDGSGAMDMSLLWAGAGVDDVNASIGMDWLMDVSAPADGSCPSGTVTMSVDTSETDQFTFTGSYDGTPTVDWTLYEAGVIVDSGTDLMDCAVPAL